ncbi:MAG TPA: acyl-CoA thioesterase domain-containing protein [Acidimicrobiales bacterium]|nr:acyl-CoA thioesterase domain-containing protein [Acidimicrobiales bacterium]
MPELTVPGTSVPGNSVPGTDQSGPDMSFGAMMQLEPHGPDTFVGAGPLYPWDGLYGGQVVAQALRAAELTVRNGFAPHSLHAFFLRMGDAREPVRFEVERLRDGRSFIARHVVARQSAGAILNMAASFQAVGEPTMDVQLARPPSVGPPSSGTEMSWSPLFELSMVEGSYQSDTGHYVHPSLKVAGARREARARAGDAAPAEVPGATAGDPQYLVKPGHGARASTWSRMLEEMGDSPSLHAAALAFISDSGPAWLAGALLEATYRPQKPWRPLSLDHTMWFHRPFRADRWLLFEAEASSLYASRGVAQGRVFDEEGMLVATIAQEVFLRRPQANDDAAP